MVLTIQLIALVIELLCLAYAIHMLIKINKLDKDKRLFRNKSDVTDEAVRAVAQYLLENKQGLRFEYERKTYILKVTEV